MRDGKYVVSYHAFTRLRERGIAAHDIRHVILYGSAASKDSPSNPNGRKPGINFEGETDNNQLIRVKVTWRKGYAVVTVHEVGNG